ncbi:hypothetical protein [Chryseobacterium jejuense]|uniref:hypothetical protein n=1 Tax=Chryseobacterium jejuense TaxID=445960 RepID=UPI001AE63C01|nr:hypothetical protein [Chryseobacterium jejuense]MBP2619654.1 hypothetical protein [Chryseobacterium jejuense]
MKVLLYIAFMVSFGWLLFRLPVLYPKNKALRITGLGIIAGFLFFIIAPLAFLLYATKFDRGILIYEKQLFNICLGIISLFFYSFFVLLFTEVILDNILIRFHQVHNAQNLDKNPVKFVINNADKIKTGFKLFFLLGGFLVYYGICFGA